MRHKFTHGSLFSGGAAGFDLAAEWMGWENIFHCEVDLFSKKLLKQRDPNSHVHGDITKTDFTIYRGIVDVLTGGWPCQDNSKANQSATGQSGLQGERSSLFYHTERAICEIRPLCFVGENVPDLLTVNGGRDFNIILSSMARMGYDVTWGMLRASDIGAPHHRERLYMVAYTGNIGFQTLQSIWKDVRASVNKRRRIVAGAVIQVGGAWETESDFLRMDDGIPDRQNRFKCLGNAVIPQIPYEIFKSIQSIANEQKQG